MVFYIKIRTKLYHLCNTMKILNKKKKKKQKILHSVQIKTVNVQMMSLNN